LYLTFIPDNVCYDVQTVTEKLVKFGTHFQFANNEVVVVPSTLRFMNRAEVAEHLHQAGFTNLEWFGDWDGSPLQANSPEIIVVAN
jgi:hypothetical protein